MTAVGLLDQTLQFVVGRWQQSFEHVTEFRIANEHGRGRGIRSVDVGDGVEGGDGTGWGGGCVDVHVDASF